MDIREALLKEHSKQQTLLITDYVGRNKKRISTLMMLFMGNEYRVTQRAAWVVKHVFEAHPDLAYPYLDEMVDILFDESRHASVRRNLLKIIDEVIEIPERHYGKLATLCFDLVASMQEPIAIKVFSMGVLCKIIKKEPDLAGELIIIIEDQMPHASPGFKSRGKRVLKFLNGL